MYYPTIMEDRSHGHTRPKKSKKDAPTITPSNRPASNGKPRIVWQKYLGTLETILARAEQTRPPAPREAVIFEAGGVAALLRLAQRLELLELINEIVPKRDQGPTVGHYLLLAAINRALDPCSKLAIGDWYERTVLCRLWRFPKSAFSSQRFWDHMDLVSAEDIQTIQDRLLPRIQSVFGIDPSLLLYDTTNFFTFISSVNTRADLAQRGHSKAKRHDLRQIGLALLVTRQFQIPLLHRTYPGNIPDVSLFPRLAREMIAHYGQLAGSSTESTLVFDKGNVSEDGMEELVVAGVHFVAALSANRLPELLACPLEEFVQLAAMPGTRARTTTTEIFGRTCRVVVTYTESFFTQQLSGVTQNLVRCQKKLLDFEKSLAQWRSGKARGKRPTVRQVRQSVRTILSAQFMNDLFKVSVEEENGLPCLRYELDHDALQRLSDQRLGRTLLVTDRLEWTAEQTVTAYRSLTSVEESFKNMKHIDFLHWQPAWHWTDQKLQVHAFYCVLALLLATLARQQVVQAGLELSLPALLSELNAIREVAVLYPSGTLAHRKDHLTLSRMTPRGRKLAEILQLGEIIVG